MNPTRLRPETRMGVALLLLAGCRGVSAEVEPDSHASSTSSSGAASSSGSTVALADDTRGTSTSADPTGYAFLLEPDVGANFECDTFEQSCPKGEKCTVWANDGGDSWNATRCVPVAVDPAGEGEPCHVKGSSHSGIDDCELGAICLYVDPTTLDGICRDYCIGTSFHPACEDPNGYCLAGSILSFCVQWCVPVEQDCPPNEGCYPFGTYWYCAVDASGAAGAYGDPCEAISTCDPGLACVEASAVPPGRGCELASECCTEVCDLTDPAGDLQCAGAADGQVCLPWYDEDAPAGYESTGVCTLPA